MKTIETLNKIIKNLDGSLIGIGINEKQLIETIEKNNNIKECNLLDSYSEDSKEKGKTKKIKIKSLRKKFKRKRTNYIIYNAHKLEELKEKFVYDSMYICNKKIYLYNNQASIEGVIRRYSRFSTIKKIECSDGIIYEITQTKKMSRLNELIYNIIDSLINLIDLISSLLS